MKLGQYVKNQSNERELHRVKHGRYLIELGFLSTNFYLNHQRGLQDSEKPKIILLKMASPKFSPLTSTQRTVKTNKGKSIPNRYRLSWT